jgi:hypothetical protein
MNITGETPVPRDPPTFGGHSPGSPRVDREGGGCYNRRLKEPQGRRNLRERFDPEKLRGLAAGLERFRHFEKGIEEGIVREEEDRRLKLQEKKRLREKKARKKRLKQQASASAG